MQQQDKFIPVRIGPERNAAPVQAMDRNAAIHRLFQPEKLLNIRLPIGKKRAKHRPNESIKRIAGG
ncbi:hypothetical protein [Sphingobium sp. CAP-1]|uniref:hypothetical protein n=1 Tax=Sphingobium sp. CAP-1 TaxID=2676077 RepID=UPI0012BB450B|nr:hypothetical protein [Sphingobium sp. CAP-1]QGP78608.1 hypothetical protein GL174_06135 [Sphingobium sp. CAP-1]